MSNMRQRIAKAKQQQQQQSPGRDSLSKQSSSWEITSDDGDYGRSVGDFMVGSDVSNTSMTSIPMYNPLHYQSSSGPAEHANTINLSVSSPSSNPLSWDQIIDAKNANASHLRKVGGGRKPHSTGFIGLRSSHLPSLAPAFIPDSRYQAYLLGRPKNVRKSAIDKICMAKFCSYFSMVGFMFMMFVGIIIDRQPMYIAGVLPKHVQYTTGDRGPQVFYAVDISDRLEPASHAYKAAFLYFITACLSLGYAYNAHWFIKSKMNHYHDIPDTDSTVPTFHNGDDGILPTSMHRHGGYNHRWQSAYVTMKRTFIYLASLWPEFLERRRNRRQRFAGAKDV